MSNRLNALCQEYAAWNAAQGLDLGSADEHLFDAALSDEQRAWLLDFVGRWDAAQALDIYEQNHGCWL